MKRLIGYTYSDSMGAGEEHILNWIAGEDVSVREAGGIIRNMLAQGELYPSENSLMDAMPFNERRSGFEAFCVTVPYLRDLIRRINQERA